jgi:hypothetical protein
MFASGDSQFDRYRAIAVELRHLIPKMQYAEVAEQPRLLAISYRETC